MRKRNKIRIIAASIALSVFIIDQITKILIHTYFSVFETRPVISGFFNLVYTKNLGAAFSFLNNAPAWFRKPFFMIVPLAAMIVVFILLKKYGEKSKLKTTAFSLILGGALGNFVDRLHYGFVIDFLDFHIGSHHWPAFNVADIAITVAIGLIFFDMFFWEKRKKVKERGKRKK